VSIDGVTPIGPRPIEAVQPHRRVEERTEEEREQPERHGSEPSDEELQDDVEDDGLPHLDIRI
jgi:hypothetical protein